MGLLYLEAVDECNESTDEAAEQHGKNWEHKVVVRLALRVGQCLDSWWSLHNLHGQRFRVQWGHLSCISACNQGKHQTSVLESQLSGFYYSRFLHKTKFGYLLGMSPINVQPKLGFKVFKVHNINLEAIPKLFVMHMQLRWVKYPKCLYSESTEVPLLFVNNETS